MLSIERHDGKVVCEFQDVLEGWKSNFEKLGIPKDTSNFGNAHYQHVTEFVNDYNMSNEIHMFFEKPFSKGEITKQLNIYIKSKMLVPTTLPQHIVHAGDALIGILVILFNAVRDLENILACCRVVVQVPLHKGKSLCPHYPNNYRGITLLSIIEELFC